MPECLILDEVTKSFGHLRAVAGASCSVAEGEIFGVVGPNGAGKTTLFNLISGVGIHADAGSVHFYGKDITRLTGSQIFRLGLARTFQRESCFETLTVEENLQVAGAYGAQRLRRRALRSEIEEVLESLELAPIRRETSRDLPLYDKKKLMIGTALMGKPRLLMLDEPVAGLNTVEAEAFSDFVRSLNRGGLTLVIIEHVLPVLFALAGRIMVMDAGMPIAEGTPQEIARNPAVIEAYMGDAGKGLLDET